LLAETDADRRWDKENITPIPCKEELQNVAKPFKRRKLPWAVSVEDWALMFNPNHEEGAIHIY
jgi:hypothetical protein